jgi:hypothetical protein
MAEQMEEATRQMSLRATGAGSPQPPPAPAATPGLTPELKEMMLKNAKVAVSAAPNAQMRQMIVEQYRLAGISIDEKGNPLD